VKKWKTILHYPIPLYTFIGLLGGIVAYLLKYYSQAHLIWMLTLIAGGIPIVYSTIKGMFHGKFASDIVAMLAIITAVMMGQAFAGAIVVLMQSGGEALEKYGLRQASSSLSALLERAPKIARRKTNGKLEEIDVKEVKIGDILIVRQGDLIPVDGMIVQGEAEIDESALTGEPLSHLKTLGEKVLSGSIGVTGTFEMRAEKVSQESQYAKIVKLVKEAQAEKAPIQRLADRYAIYFTPLTLLISCLGWLITKDATTILSVLVVATPCPLILATPIAIISGINRAAQEGIIVKGGAPLEHIAQTQVAVFDKTGTITHGTPFIDEIISCSQMDPHTLLLKAASLEQLSSHTSAQSIVRHAKEHLPVLPLPDQFQEIPGKGVEGMVEQDKVLVGSQSFIEKKLGKEAFKGKEGILERIRSKGRLTTCIAINGQVAGIIALGDRIREGAREMIQRLRDLGIEDIYLLTGDHIVNSQYIAAQAGISHVQADLLPEQKVTAIKNLMNKYPFTMMVGDGINDAPALATAKVGVAMGAQGTAISAEAAEIVLLVDDISKVGEAVYVGKRMLYIAKQSIFIGLGLSCFLMIIAAFGYIQPAVGALLQEIIDVSVILNALRAR